MSFMDAMKHELLDNYNTAYTENGAVGYRTTGKSLLDLNFSVASLRRASDYDIAVKFRNAYLENKRLAVLWLFYARDIRGGLGERNLFRSAFKFLADENPDMVISLISLVPEYGRYDDLWVLLDEPTFREPVLDFVKKQLNRDVLNMHANQPVSLLAKWLPSVNASSETTKKYAKMVYNHFNMKPSEYRKLLSRLRKYIGVIEVKMSAKDWSEIDYSNVPSRANLIYNKAFLRNDEVRRRKFLSAVENGEAKINAGTLYPHDIVAKYCNHNYWQESVGDYDSGLESLWASLPDTVKGCGNTLVVADGSGSMTTSVGKSNVTALDVANALAIYFSERCSGEFKNNYITFSMNPQFVHFNDGAPLRDKLSIAFQHDECANTNIEAVFDLILDTAVKSHMSQEDIPKNIVIISDMEFDTCARSNYTGDYGRLGSMAGKSLFRELADRYDAKGYKLPKLVFWNVNSRTGTIPMIENEMGVVLVSGFSVNICKMVMNGQTDPYDCLVETLNSERYSLVDEKIRTFV